MRLRDVDATLAAANPVGRSRVEALPLAASEQEYLLAIRTEPLPLPTAIRSRRVGGTRLRFALASLLCLLVVASAFTAPGRAVTGWVGEKIGFGEVGGPPSLRQLRQRWGRGTGAARQPAYVLAVGPAPRDGRYEFITYEPRVPAGKHGDVEGPCFELDLTQERGMSSQGCGALAAGRDLYFLGAGGNADPDRETHYVTGRTSAAVSEVEARFEGRRFEVELVPIPAALRHRLQLGPPFKFFIGFFDGARGGTVAVTARDTTGAVLGHGSSELPDARLMYRFMCRRLAGKSHPNPAAAGDCEQVLGSGWRQLDG
jgi:hypothetical protein